MLYNSNENSQLMWILKLSLYAVAFREILILGRICFSPYNLYRNVWDRYIHFNWKSFYTNILSTNWWKNIFFFFLLELNLILPNKLFSRVCLSTSSGDVLCTFIPKYFMSILYCQWNILFPSNLMVFTKKYPSFSR